MSASLLAWLVTVAWAWALGTAFCAALSRAAGCSRWQRSPPVSLLAGLVIWHLLLQLLAMLAVGWTRESLLATMALSGAAAVFALWRGRVSLRLGFAPAAWDLISLGALVAFAAVALSLRAPISDFVYHWGLKARRFFEMEGLDLEFLARPENRYLHPDYPNLVPELYASSSLLAGRFEPAALMLWSPLFLGMVALTVRQALAESLGDRRSAAMAGAGIVAVLSAFCIGYYQAGGADVPMALGLLVGALVIHRGEEAALALGMSAAFVAATKIEGIPLAALLIGCYLWRFGWRSRRSAGEWLALLAPPVVVVAAWWAPVQLYGLFQPGNAGVPRLEQLGAIVSGLWYSVSLPQWYGLPFLLVLLPLLLRHRGARWLGVVVTLQLGVYLALYLVTPVDVRSLVITSFPRLLLHLMPTLLLAILLWASPLAPRAQRPSEGGVSGDL